MRARRQCCLVRELKTKLCLVCYCEDTCGFYWGFGLIYICEVCESFTVVIIPIYC